MYNALSLRNFALATAVLALLLAAQIVFSWTGPTDSPPNDNVDAPVNVGSTDQIKGGAFGANGLVTYTNVWAHAANSYYNFGMTASAGAAGYGIRDNGGTLEFKNSGGAWANLNTVVGNYLTLNGLTLATGNGTFTGTVTAASFLYSSDARLKRDVVPLAGGILERLRPVSFVWKSGVNAGESDIGFIAQEVESVLPVAVKTNADGMKAVDYARLVPVLVQAIQEQQKEIDALKADVARLEH